MLKDQLFNAATVGQLAAEYTAVIAGFDPDCFVQQALAGFSERELMARLEWLGDCLEAQLSGDFPTMADQLERAMCAPLDPSQTDNDFGQFIHAVPGILAARHGLEDHRARAMSLIYNATQRFTMEFYIRPFLRRWPAETLAELAVWARDSNYHVRRLVSEGTRPRLPWAQNIGLTPEQTLPLLDLLHADQTRYVTRSVANHLNDLSKIVPQEVIARLKQWHETGAQNPEELVWMTRHALRTLVKRGDPEALAVLGYRADAPVVADIVLAHAQVPIGGSLAFEVHLNSPKNAPVLIDYRITFARPSGKTVQKVFKLKSGHIQADIRLAVRKQHRFKADATTFALYPGAHMLTVQVNGRDVASAEFDLRM